MIKFCHQLFMIPPYRTSIVRFHKSFIAFSIFIDRIPTEPITRVSCPKTCGNVEYAYLIIRKRNGARWPSVWRPIPFNLHVVCFYHSDAYLSAALIPAMLHISKFLLPDISALKSISESMILCICILPHLPLILAAGFSPDIVLSSNQTA